MLIRQATAADIPVIAQFQVSMAWETEHKELLPEVILPGVEGVFQEPGRGIYLVAELERRVVASLLVTFEWSDWRNCNIWYLQSVFVEQPHRGQGIFRKMYEWVVQEAKLAGSHVIRLYVETDNARAQKVYESVGMKRLPYFMYEVHI
jgi:GNAT superfamily N-acetyltransferase